MLAVNRGLKRSIQHFLMLLAAGALVASPAMAQINTVDPNDVIDSDLGTPPPAATAAPAQEVAPTVQDGVPTEAPAKLPETSSASSTSPAISTENTYQEDDLIGVAESVFGKSAQGIAKFIEDILKKEGRPNAYIVGREGGGAFVVGLRYGSGTLNHKVEGKMPIYWTGPIDGPVK